MNCLEFRRALGADPNHASPESLAHRAQCPTCDKYAQEMLRLNGLIKRALEIPARSDKSSRSAAKVKWFAMAASVTLAIGIAAGIWLLGYPRSTLAKDVVEHLTHEPGAMTVTEARIANEVLEGVLQAKGMHLAQPMSDVSYLETCVIRDKLSPHLVVQTGRGPVTVLILAEEKIKETSRFDEQNYHGVLVPLQHGGIAVIATDVSLVDSVAKKVSASIAWD